MCRGEGEGEREREDNRTPLTKSGVEEEATREKTTSMERSALTRRSESPDSVVRYVTASPTVNMLDADEGMSAYVTTMAAGDAASPPANEYVPKNAPVPHDEVGPELTA